LRSAAGYLGVAASAVLLALAPGTVAHADPSPSAIEAQIDTMWNQLEPLIEQYNGVHLQLKASQAKAAALQKQLEPLQAQVDAAMSQVSNMAVSMYKAGRASKLNALLSSGSPTALADQLVLLNQLAVSQRLKINDVAAARDRYASQKKALDDVISQQSAQDVDLAAKKKQIEDQIANLQKLRLQAYGTGGGTGALRPVACPVEYIGGAAGKAAATACSKIGKPYRFAEAGPNYFDCSGLTQFAWASAGVSLSHQTTLQWNETKHISRADLRVGDLVFFYGDRHHVAIYVGADWVVHAPHSDDFVRMAKISQMGPVNGYARP
jgi:cell wall-associated NlpC family hydrolase